MMRSSRTAQSARGVSAISPFPPTALVGPPPTRGNEWLKPGEGVKGRSGLAAMRKDQEISDLLRELLFKALTDGMEEGDARPKITNNVLFSGYYKTHLGQNPHSSLA